MGTEYRNSLGVRQLPRLSVEEFWETRKPCWESQNINALCAKYRRSNWTALEVLSLDEVPAADRLWVVLHDSMLPSVVLRRFAVEVAAEAMRKADHFDPRSWAALDAALAYERGEIGAAASDAALAAVWDAAKDAAWAAASDAAWAAAKAAASAAAWAAASAAARYAASDAASAAASAAAKVAARSAAGDAARSAAKVAARDAQIVMLRQITLRWLGGEDIAAGGPWKRPQSSARSSSDCASSASRIHSENERSSPRAVDA